MVRKPFPPESENSSVTRSYGISSGYAIHPDAFADLDEISDYIAQQSPGAADRVILEIFESEDLCDFPTRVIDGRTLARDLCGSLLFVNT